MSLKSPKIVFLNNEMSNTGQFLRFLFLAFTLNLNFLVFLRILWRTARECRRKIVGKRLTAVFVHILCAIKCLSSNQMKRVQDN